MTDEQQPATGGPARAVESALRKMPKRESALQLAVRLQNGMLCLDSDAHKVVVTTAGVDLLDEWERSIRAAERERILRALRTLRDMKPPDQRDVDYALQRIEERGLEPLIDELNRSTS